MNKSHELFKAYSRLNSKKTLSFTTEENFTVAIDHDDASALPPGVRYMVAKCCCFFFFFFFIDMRMVGCLIDCRVRLGVYEVTGVPTSGEQYNFTGKPKVHASFRLNSNGMFVLEKAEAEITATHIVTGEVFSTVA